MPRDPNIPAAFDVYTLVLLRRPPDAPQMPEAELDRLQGEHLAYRAELRRTGVLVVNGPMVAINERMGFRPVEVSGEFMRSLCSASGISSSGER